jgi:L-lactate permease
LFLSYIRFAIATYSVTKKQLSNTEMKAKQIIELFVSTIILVILFYWLLNIIDHHAVPRQLTLPIVFIIADIVFLAVFFVKLIKPDKQQHNL